MRLDMNCHNLDQLLDHFNGKIDVISQLIPLSQLCDKSDKNDWKRNAVLNSNHLNHNSDNYCRQLSDKRPDLREISQMVTEMKATIEEIKRVLRQRKEEMICQNIRCDNDLNQIQRHCDYIHKNIPTFLQNLNKSKPLVESNQMAKNEIIGHKSHTSKVNTKTKTVPKSNPNVKSTQETRVVTKSLKKKTVFKNLSNVAIISFLTTEEFASIPQYILGRLTYEVVNRAIADINRTIAAKYKIIANYSTKYSDEEMRKYVKFKEQENSETDGQFFCTINDLKELSDLKVDPIVRKILTCLRHCKRIREIRGNPPKLVRYAVIKSDLNVE